MSAHAVAMKPGFRKTCGTLELSKREMSADVHPTYVSKERHSSRHDVGQWWNGRWIWVYAMLNFGLLMPPVYACQDCQSGFMRILMSYQSYPNLSRGILYQDEPRSSLSILSSRIWPLLSAVSGARSLFRGGAFCSANATFCRWGHWRAHLVRSNALHAAVSKPLVEASTSLNQDGAGHRAVSVSSKSTGNNKEQINIDQLFWK